MLDDVETPREEQEVDLILLLDNMEGINVFIDYIMLKDRYKNFLAKSSLSGSKRVISLQKDSPCLGYLENLSIELLLKRFTVLDPVHLKEASLKPAASSK